MQKSAFSVLCGMGFALVSVSAHAQQTLVCPVKGEAAHLSVQLLSDLSALPPIAVLAPAVAAIDWVGDDGKTERLYGYTPFVRGVEVDPMSCDAEEKNEFTTYDGRIRLSSVCAPKGGDGMTDVLFASTLGLRSEGELKYTILSTSPDTPTVRREIEVGICH